MQRDEGFQTGSQPKMLSNEDEEQEEINSLLHNNRLLRRTYRQMNEELQALNGILQEKLQKSRAPGGGLRSAPPTTSLVQNEEHLHSALEIQSLQRSNSYLHQLNATLAQFQMTTFKKLVDITRPEKRPEKQTQTRSQWPGSQRRAELQALKEELQKELQQLQLETGVAKKEERLSQSRCSCLNICIRMTELHNNNRRRLLEQVRENQLLTLQVRLLEEQLQQRRSVEAPAAHLLPPDLHLLSPDEPFNWSQHQDRVHGGTFDP